MVWHNRAGWQTRQGRQAKQPKLSKGRHISNILNGMKMKNKTVKEMMMVVVERGTRSEC